MDSDFAQKFATILLEEKFVVNERHAQMKIQELETEGSERWYSNGSAEFKLLRQPRGEWFYYNFRQIVGNRSLARVEELFAQNT